MFDRRKSKVLGYEIKWSVWEIIISYELIECKVYMVDEEEEEVMFEMYIDVCQIWEGLGLNREVRSVQEGNVEVLENFKQSNLMIIYIFGKLLCKVCQDRVKN